MKMKFFKRLAEKIRQPFKKEEPEVIPETVAEVDVVTVDVKTADSVETDAEAGIGVEAELELEENSGAGSNYSVRQAQHFLFKGGKPIGKPFGRCPEIRIVYVNNFVESFLFFLRLCDQRLLTCQQAGRHLDCNAVFPDGNGSLTFTDRVSCRNKAVIAVLKIEINGLQPKLSEIRFEIKQ